MLLTNSLSSLVFQTERSKWSPVEPEHLASLLGPGEAHLANHHAGDLTYHLDYGGSTLNDL